MKWIKGTAVFRRCNTFPEWSIEDIKVDELHIPSSKVAQRYIEHQLKTLGNMVKLIQLEYKTKPVKIQISNDDYLLYINKDKVKQ